MSRVYLEVQEAGEEDQRPPQRPGEEGDQSDQQQHVLHQPELRGQQGQHQGGSLSRQGDRGLGQVTHLTSPHLQTYPLEVQIQMLLQP